MKVKVDYTKLEQIDAKELLEFETRLYQNIHRYEAQRREEKLASKKKKKRSRRG